MSLLQSRLEVDYNALLQSMLVLHLRVQLVTLRVLRIWDYMAKCATFAMVYLLRLVFALLQSMLELKLSPLELAACFHIVGASELAPCFFVRGGGTSEHATLLLSTLCLMLVMMNWHVPRSMGCHMFLCRSLSAMCMQCFRADYACIAMAFLFPTFGKRPAEQVTEGCSERDAATSSATERTPRATTAETADPTLLCSASSVGAERVLPNAVAQVNDVNEMACVATADGGQSLHASLDDIVARLQPSHHENALRIRAAAETLKRGSQQDIRNLCKPFGVSQREKKNTGKYGNRPDRAIKDDLMTTLVRCGRGHLDALEFDMDASVAETLRSLAGSVFQSEILARIVDHACSSEHAISSKMAAMCSRANWITSTELCNDQPMDACGYIAADVVCRLRDAALAETDGWHKETLPDYASHDCIYRGNAVLHKGAGDRVLDSDEVNSLVRHYTGLAQRLQAAEEWWGGAVALDQFMAGILGTITELARTTNQQQHLFRAWIVNTQTSAMLGSHWVTIVVGIRAPRVLATGLLQSDPKPAQATVETFIGALDDTGQRKTQKELTEQEEALGTSTSDRALDNAQAAASSTSPATERMESPTGSDKSNGYLELFANTDKATRAACSWATENLTDPDVAAWKGACANWHTAVTTGDYKHQKKRRKLFKEIGVSCNRACDESAENAIVLVRNFLSGRIQQIRSTRRVMMAMPKACDNKPVLKNTAAAAQPQQSTHHQPPLLQSKARRKRTVSSVEDGSPSRKQSGDRAHTLAKYFKLGTTSAGPSEIEPLDTPDVATDVGSTYLLFQRKRGAHAGDKDFQIVRNALCVLRGYVDKRRLHDVITDPPKTQKTIRQHFKEKYYTTLSYSHSQCSVETDGAKQSEQRRSLFTPSLTWRTYYVKLLVLAQARRWLSATERLDPIEDAPPTPKTILQLADAIRHLKTAQYAPFGCDFEDDGAYSPLVTRLLLYAEIHDCDDHGHGTFASPRQMMPYTYRQLHDWITERRRLQQQSKAAEGSSRQLVQTAEDLAAKLRAFASDGIVVKHLIEFALPYKKRANAAEVRLKVTSEASGNRSNSAGVAKEHTIGTTENIGDDAERAQDNIGDAERRDDRRQAMSEGTDHAINQQKRLKKHDDGHKADTHHVTLSQSTAKAMADNFFRFVQDQHLQEHVSPMSAGQIVVLCIFHSRLLWQKGKPIELNDRDQYWIPRPVYTPASAVKSPSPPHFVELLQIDADERSRPQIQPPRVCCLCGKGFIDSPALWKHCQAEHHSWAEARKRMLWEAEKLESIPLLPCDKRRLIQNFTAALSYCMPGEGHFGGDQVCMRQLVGCATCARVEWIDQCFPCFLFKECPDALRPKSDDTEDEMAESDASSDEETSATERRRGVLLKDKDGYYVADPHKINQLLSVDKYIQAWPLIPIEELHASTVQHPMFQQYRWLLNTRRVPVRALDQPAAATELGPHEAIRATERILPTVAGIGLQDEPVWLCKSCIKALCRPEPLMPFFALANWNWGGRLHPLYYNLSIAMKSLLGLAIMVCRMVVLRYSEHEEDQEKGFVGNTILLAQPNPEEVIQKLPPADAEVSKYMSVCFNSKAMTKEDVGKHRALEIDPQQYIKCSELRKQVCPVFAKVEVDAEQVRTQWPETGVPQAIILSAQGMDTLHTFSPTLDGPASMRAATCTLPTDGNDREVIDDDDEAIATEHGKPSGDSDGTSCAATKSAPGTDDATERFDSMGLPLDLPAEFLIGVQENEAQDPVDRMLAVQKLFELVHEKAKALHRLEQRRQQCPKSSVEDSADAAAQLAAEKASFTASLVELKRLTSSMGDRYHAQMLEALRSARMEGANDNTGKTLHIKSGKPMNMFAAPAWPAAFVEFFYGDCAPNLDRPRKVGVRELFDYLASREELEYSLASDKDNPLIPAGCYRAPAQSRWDTPEFMAVFADVVRKILILQTTSPMWTRDPAKWKADIREIAKCSVAQFEQLSTILAQHGQQSMQQMMHAAAQHKLLPVFKALQYLTFQTANIPLTQGYKVSLRQLGFGLNVYDGPLTVFLTTNFADMYSPIAVTLMNGAGEPLGRRDVNLLQSVPCMPTLQAMHRSLAKHPYIQVRLFLLLDELVHTELLCTHAFIGLRGYSVRHAGGPTQEDDFASTGEIGIAHFVRSALKPLEAQGRGFSHGHEKVISVPRTRAARLKQLFTATATEHGSDELGQWCERARDAVLRAASTLQYDSAVLPGTQLGVALRPEPFTSIQQKRSRYDGQVEEAHDNAPLRRLIAVTAREPNGHLKAEEARATAEQRPMHHPYKELPLTGATQSLMPMYRLSSSFGNIEIPDEFGYYPDAATERADVDAPMFSRHKEFEVQSNGEITGFCLPTGRLTSAQDLQADCDAWATSFARDQRGSFIQNHDHDCTATCVKYEQKQRTATELPQRCGQKISGPGVPKCRFRFFRYVEIIVLGVIKYVLRRGKDLVERAFIATGNEENEFGKAVVVRGMPFRSSSSDVLQATIRCNADYQYQKRAVPDILATEQEPNAARRADTENEVRQGFIGRLLVGCGGSSSKNDNQIVLAMLATAMRAANVADFYMTKYLSKAQQALGPVIQPFITGLRRIEAEESAPDAPETTLTQRAKKRVLRFIFSANRTLWFSACELGIFLATGSSCVKTEENVKVFSGRGIAMMHECKRQLNHTLSSEGLLCAARTAGRSAPSALHAVLVAPHGDIATQSEAESHATDRGDVEDLAVSSDDGGCLRTGPAKSLFATDGSIAATHVGKSDQGPATELAGFEEDDCDPTIPDIITAPDSNNIVKIRREKHRCSRKAPDREMIGCIVDKSCRTLTTTIIPVISTGWRCQGEEAPQGFKRDQASTFCSMRTTPRASITSKCFGENPKPCKT